jgi:DNA (cytosine-5)-methyltransferase 1
LARAYPREARIALQDLCPSEMGAGHRRPRFWLAAHADGQGEFQLPIDAEVAGIQEDPKVTPWIEGPGGVLGMDDGVAHRVDRIRALGNGQVPAVVLRAWRTLMELTTEAKVIGAGAPGRIT